MSSRYDLEHIASDIGAELQACEAEKLVPPLGDVCDPVSSPVDGSFASAISNTQPVLAHVVEADGARTWVLEISDELAQNPRLFGIFDSSVDLLHNGCCQNPGPGDVFQLNFRVRAQFEARRVQSGSGWDLVGYRDHAVETAGLGDIDVRL